LRVLYIAKSQALPPFLEGGVDEIELFPPKAVAGNWELVVAEIVTNLGAATVVSVWKGVDPF